MRMQPDEMVWPIYSGWLVPWMRYRVSLLSSRKGARAPSGLAGPPGMRFVEFAACRQRCLRQAILFASQRRWRGDPFGLIRLVSSCSVDGDPLGVSSGCSRLAQSWSDLLWRADVFDELSVILVRAMSGRPYSGNALPLHLRDRHKHTFVYLFHPFSCPVLTLVQLSDGERFLYSRRLQGTHKQLTTSLSGSASNDSNRCSTAGASCFPKSVIKITAPRSESQDCRDK